VASTGSLAAKVRPSGPGRRLVAHLWAFLAGPSLDFDLADGVSPSASLSLSIRAHRITRPRARLNLALALRSAIDAAGQPIRPMSARIPVDADAVLSCQAELRALAESIATIEQPRARGVAIARQLAFDGRSPIFLQPPLAGNGGREKLTSTLQAARRSLEVSADFDRA
jgi:hypothetical protein